MVHDHYDVLRVNDELLERLGLYFVYHNIFERYGISFEVFVGRWLRGIIDI